MTVTSGDILAAYQLNTAYLHRWREAGLIRSDDPGYGRAGGARWPDWTWRMVALIRTVGYDGTRPATAAKRTPMDVLRGCAEVLAIDPDAPWVVFTDAGVALPCHHAAEVVAIHRRQTCTTVVAIPTLEEARAA